MVKELSYDISNYDFSTIDYSGYYYNIKSLTDKYPDAFLYVVVGGRNTGKTFSTEVELIRNQEVFVYIRRSIDDLKIITTSARTMSKKGKVKVMDVDLSPMKSVNRAIGANIRLLPVQTGISAFFDCTEDLEPLNEPIGYGIALNAVSKIKGIDLSDVTAILMDEWGDMFAPRAYKEADAILELYKTITRDSVHKNKRVPIIALSNASNINAPLIEAFQLQNDMIAICNQEKDEDGRRIRVVDRDGAKIVIEMLEPNPDFLEKEKQSDLYKLTKGTKWNDFAYGNEFAYDDTSKVKTKDEFKTLISAKMPLHRAEQVFNIRSGQKVYTCAQFMPLGGDENDVTRAIYYIYENEKEPRADVTTWRWDVESDRRLFKKSMSEFITVTVESENIYFENFSVYEELYWQEYIRKGT